MSEHGMLGKVAERVGVLEDFAATDRESQVTKQMKELCFAIDALEEINARCIDRLTPIMRANSRSGGDDNIPPVEVLVPLADKLRTITERIKIICEYMSCAVDRFEL